MDYLCFTSDNSLLFTYDNKDYIISSIDDWKAAVADIKSKPTYVKGATNFMCSSSIDFPKEYTDDEDLINLCIAICNT